MDLDGLISFLRGQPLLVLALAAIFASSLGSILARWAPRSGRAVASIGQLGIVAAMLLTIAQVARITSGSDFSLGIAGMAEQRVEGGETRVPLSGDGHFWVTATVNGTDARFLVDTGATLTAVSQQTADATGLEPSAIRQQVILQTANGATTADMASIGELRFGNIVARDLDAVIGSNLGKTNVIGMNLLSRLASWRVEGRTLILTPKSPQPIKPDAA
jgi:aspartyl protease family protein